MAESETDAMYSESDDGNPVEKAFMQCLLKTL